MTYKTETTDAYNKYANDFEAKFQEYTAKYMQRLLGASLGFIPRGSRILDIGCGSGEHSLYFKSKGYSITSIDISPEMIKICKSKGLDARVMDLENLDFPDSSYDGIWAQTSLLHIPKGNIDSVLKKIANILKPDGVLFLCMKEGEGDGFVEDIRYPGVRRWFALYGDDELRTHLKPYFEVVSFEKINPRQTAEFLNYAAKKRF